MSKTNNDRDYDIFNRPLSKSAVQSLETNLNKSTKNLKHLQKDVEMSTLNAIDDTDNLISNINSKVNQVFASMTHSGNTSDVNSDVLDNMILMSKKHSDSDKTKKNVSSKKMEEELDKLKESVTSSNADNLEQLMNMHKTKTMDAMATYNLIVKSFQK